MLFTRLEWQIAILLTYVLLLHASTLYIFSRGFLLTRLSLPNLTECTECTLPPTHSRLVLLIIDALRFDFLAEKPSINPSPYYHNVLTLPAELTAKYPSQSFLFDTYSDPPTATLQRIKGITTGSLPTFIDVGSNFGGSQILEDSLINQLRQAQKKIAFMGDDTWMTVYPTSFEITYPFDSFNVEDLHTVDEGVIEHIFPLLQKNMTSSWDVLIGHFLGVDHVGHRLGPAHPTMTAKLAQMNEVLSRVVEALDDDTLLVVLGDHGMDRKGDHGGDGDFETHAATWIYSKSKPLSSPRVSLPSLLVPENTFPEAPVSHRFIQQIDLVPTISLLLGIPIPFNNLGTIIPEVFGWQGGRFLEQAMRLNANQIKEFLNAYRASSSGGELDAVWDKVEESWTHITQTKGTGKGDQALEILYEFNRFILSSCRSFWARFNIILMYIGLSCMALGTAAVFALYSAFGSASISIIIHKLVIRLFLSLYASSFMGVVFWFSFPALTLFIGFTELMLVCTTLTSSLTILATLMERSFFTRPSIILVLHALAFLSNSFTFWEERIMTFLLTSSAIPFLFAAFSHPGAAPALRRRLILFSIGFIICIRLASISTICREEQQPYCRVTYYGSSTQSSPPLPVLALSIPVSLLFPYMIRRFLAISASDKGPAPYFLEGGLRTMLVMGNLAWILEYAESVSPENSIWLRAARTELARFAIGLSLFAGHLIWWFSPLCLEVLKSPIRVLGFANSYGSMFTLFSINTFVIIFTTTQLSGQLALILCYLALFMLLEMVDSVEDLRKQPWILNPFGLEAIAPVALLGLLAFFTTGHEATPASIQWKSAFLLTPVLKYPISPVSVFLNSLGPLFIFAVSAPLIALWKKTPLEIGKHENKSFSISTSTTILLSTTRVCLGVSLYFSVLLLSSAASAAWLRRHLMVWKVFAPRFMLAGMFMLTVDVGLLIGGFIGVYRVVHKVRTFYQPWELDSGLTSR